MLEQEKLSFEEARALLKNVESPNNREVADKTELEILRDANQEMLKVLMFLNEKVEKLSADNAALKSVSLEGATFLGELHKYLALSGNMPYEFGYKIQEYYRNAQKL